MSNKGSRGKSLQRIVTTSMFVALVWVGQQIGGCTYDFDAAFGGAGAGNVTDGGPGDDAQTVDASAGSAGTGGSSAGTGGSSAGSAGAGGSSAGSGGSNVNTCPPEMCAIEAQCVHAGTPNPADPCQVCLPSVSAAGWAKDTSNITCAAKAQPWAGVTHVMAVTPYGHANAVVCSKCFSSSIQATTGKIGIAINDGADLIDLPVYYANGELSVQRVQTTNDGPTFAEVLSYMKSATGDYGLSLSLIGGLTEQSMRSLLISLRDCGFATAGRPVILRATVQQRAQLLLARTALGTSELVDMRPNVQLHEMLSTDSGDDVASMHASIKAAHDDGFHGIGFSYKTHNMFSGIRYAQSLKMATGVRGLMLSGAGDAFFAAFRDEVDMMHCQYSLVKPARAAIARPNGLAYVNVAAQSASSHQFRWYGVSKNQGHTAHLNLQTAPKLVSHGVGDSLYGTSLDFTASSKQAVPLYDASKGADRGFLVAAVVRFKTFKVPTGQEGQIVSKSESGGFNFVLRSWLPNTSRLLFQLYLGGHYRRAQYSIFQLDGGAPKLTTTDSYFLVGSYDGNGSIGMWIDGSSDGVYSVGNYSGAVGSADVPITLGADPSSSGALSNFFDGFIQTVIVQSRDEY